MTAARKRIYVAGPISGGDSITDPAVLQANVDRFHDAARRLRGLGYAVENPAENLPPAGGAWVDWMRLGLTQLLLCNAVALLPGWQDSDGAKVEYHLATALHYDVRPLVAWGVPS